MASSLENPVADHGKAPEAITPVSRAIAAWLIDLDGTLYRPFGVKAAMAVQLALRGRGAIGTLRAFRSELEKVRMYDDCDCDNPFQTQLFRTATSLELDIATVEATVTDWMFHRPGRWIRLFRRRSLLAEIVAFRQSGGRTALVSDYPARLKLQALGAADLFDVVVASGEPGGPPRLKPAPDGYLLAAERLSANPADCLVIGDRLDTDGEAARQAGMAFRKVR